LEWDKITCLELARKGSLKNGAEALATYAKEIVNKIVCDNQLGHQIRARWKKEKVFRVNKTKFKAALK